jgi:hypothetical protein
MNQIGHHVLCSDARVESCGQQACGYDEREEGFNLHKNRRQLFGMRARSVSSPASGQVEKSFIFPSGNPLAQLSENLRAIVGRSQVLDAADERLVSACVT